MSSLRKFIPYLTEFEYPNIADASDEYLEEVFSAENRQFLLRWLIKQLNSKLIIATDWSQNTKLTLADYFSNNGFCLNSEKQKFVTKDDSLSLEQEIAIFERIFNYMHNSSRGKEDKENLENELTTKELETLLSKEVDLFPKLKAVKLRGTAEKVKKIEQLRAEIEKFKKLTENYCSQNAIEETCEVSENDIANKVDKFTNQLINLQSVASQVKLTDSLCNEASHKSTHSEMNFGEKLSDFDCESKQLLKYFQNVNLMQEVSQNRENVKYKNEMEQMRQGLFKDTSEIVEMNKNQQ